MPKHDSIPPPKGTRDLYPEDLLRQRYITEAWRRVSIRQGFEEIAGPTFEMLDLYKKKSGEGIVSELFSFRRTGGDDDYALRPEFTPTLARMYAAKANALPSPCKWFTAGPYFRAEKPQRGRLREFLQWNCDVMGDESPQADADVINPLFSVLDELGIAPVDIRVRLGDRKIVESALRAEGVTDSQIEAALHLLDRAQKIDSEALQTQSKALGFEHHLLRSTLRSLDDGVTACLHSNDDDFELTIEGSEPVVKADIGRYRELAIALRAAMNNQRTRLDITNIVRGLAYYTGTVFELIADGERAVAGGGRYDNLIELFGGPPTPAVGFGMGDVVLGLLLEDKGLMPEGPALMDALSQKPASLRPEAFVIATEAGEPHVEPLLAQLRRGVESDAWKERSGKPWDTDRYEIAPMHARRSYKSTRNIGKLLAEARKQHAKFAVIIDSADTAKIENLDTREAFEHVPLERVGATIAARL